MAYENPLMTELMVPRDPEVSVRIHGFYEAIHWEVRNASDSEYFTYVHPGVSEGVPPTLAYWQTETESKTGQFHNHKDPDPSLYARGLRLPILQELVEVCLVVPTDDDVHAIFEKGGKLLERHTQFVPRDHAGKQEFRFGDPFNYSLRVTADPGWEIPKALRKVEGLTNEEYDPQRASLLPEYDGEDLIAVVTKVNLNAFLKENGQKPGLAERLVNGLAYAARKDPAIKDMLYGTDGEHGFTADGIRVNSIRHVISLLNADIHRNRVRNVGSGSTGLLERYCEVLFPKAPTAS